MQVAVDKSTCQKHKCNAAKCIIIIFSPQDKETTRTVFGTIIAFILMQAFVMKFNPLSSCVTTCVSFTIICTSHEFSQDWASPAKHFNVVVTNGNWTCLMENLVMAHVSQGLGGLWITASVSSLNKTHSLSQCWRVATWERAFWQDNQINTRRNSGCYDNITSPIPAITTFLKANVKSHLE